MKLTKIIPCYNEDKYIEKFTISVNSQPFHDKQIIVVDEGLKNGTKKYLSQELLALKGLGYVVGY